MVTWLLVSGIILAAALILLAMVLIRRKQGAYLFPKIKGKKNLYVNDRGVNVDSGRLGSRDYFHGMSKEKFETILSGESPCGGNVGCRRKELHLTDVDSGQTYQASFSDGMIIGRTGMGDGEHSCLPIRDTSISGKHCWLFVRGGSVYVEDLGSTNKTCLNGRIVETAQPVKNGDVLKLGRRKFRLEIR